MHVLLVKHQSVVLEPILMLGFSQKSIGPETTGQVLALGLGRACLMHFEPSSNLGLDLGATFSLLSDSSTATKKHDTSEGKGEIQ
jgi:hypothetical protein